MVPILMQYKRSGHRVPGLTIVTIIRENVIFCGRAKALLALMQLHKLFIVVRPLTIGVSISINTLEAIIAVT